jgi:OOP family OmpA-OmpF porin
LNLRPALLLVLCLPACSFQDAEGCKDSKLMSRFRGCVISECRANEFDTARMLTGRSEAAEEILKDVEGALEEVTYTCPEGISALQLSRNAEGALRQAGFTIVYNGKDGWDNPAVTGRKGAQWIFVRQSPGSNAYTMTAVLEKKMDQEMTVNAEGLAAEIEKSGRVAVYGITFDTAKATLKPESEAVLGEIQKLLAAHADWNMRVEGHTDNTGGKVANQALSAQRAASVAAWLAAHGIDKARLTPQGFGDSKPVADNASPEGRAKNRRVELVKM